MSHQGSLGLVDSSVWFQFSVAVKPAQIIKREKKEEKKKKELKHLLSDCTSCSYLQKAKSKARLCSQANAHFVIANHTDNTFNLEILPVELSADTGKGSPSAAKATPRGLSSEERMRNPT